MDFLTLLDYLIRGLSLGSIYAIIALGYTMVYGIAKMLNFAHGDVIMVGAYACFFTVTGMEPMFSQGSLAAAVVPALAGVVLSMVVCTVLGVVIEGLAYKPLRQAPSLAVLITAIGVSYFLQNAALLLWSSSPKYFTPIVGSGSAEGGPAEHLLCHPGDHPGLCGYYVLPDPVHRQNQDGQGHAGGVRGQGRGPAHGHQRQPTISMTFAIGSALAAIAGVLLCSAYPTLAPTTGSMPGIKAFTAAVFGGIGSIPGALLGGLLLGIIEIFAKAYISTQLSDAIVFAVLIVVLLVKPAGLLGKTVREKV